MNEQKELALNEEKAISTELDFPALFNAAMQNERALEIIERLTALKNEEEERRKAEEMRQAKLSFMRDFAEMQKDFEPVKRTKINKQYNSKYAGIDDLQRQYGPILSKNGFSYDWREEQQEDGRTKVIFMLTKYGYTKESPLIMPKYEPTKNQMNDLQAVGTVLSYGHRYTMKSGLGITEEDEDTDGNLSFDDGAKYADYAFQLDECQTVKEAHDLKQGFYQELKAVGDNHGIEVLRILWIKRKAELS